LPAALDYAARGWAVIPTVGKKPRFAWKQYQTERPAKKLIEDWFGGRFDRITGVAVVAGPVSGGLTCRDCDCADAYRHWAAAHPDLAAALPTVRTARGYHVYFRSRVSRLVKLDDGELRGTGYTLLPPSSHPSGADYHWTVPLPNGPLPMLDPYTAGLANETQRTQEIGVGVIPPAPSMSHPSASSESYGGFPPAPSASHDAVERAIQETLPAGPGRRHRAVFELARRLKALPPLADADPRSLRPIVQEWHRLALPVIRTKAFEETWLDFQVGWGKVMFPAGAGPLDLVWARALAEAPPPAAAAYGQDGVRRLVALCYQLQRHAGEGTWFLACRTAESLLGVPYQTTSRWLRLLEFDGLLRRISTGSKAARRANEYRYVVADDPGADATG
jgi:hypothetical protein